MDQPVNPPDEAKVSPDDESPEGRALREYERFLEQGLGEHDVLADWLATERELRSRLRRPAAAASGPDSDDHGCF